MQVGFPEVKKLFLNKIYQYIKDRSLDPKYACAFLLGFEPQQSVQDEKSEVGLTFAIHDVGSVYKYIIIILGYGNDIRSFLT